MLSILYPRAGTQTNANLAPLGHTKKYMSSTFCYFLHKTTQRKTLVFTGEEAKTLCIQDIIQDSRTGRKIQATLSHIVWIQKYRKKSESVHE
jgi:hypothetical protein